MIDTDDMPLNIEEAANFMRLGQKALQKLIEDGELPAARLNQKHTAVLKSDAIAYLRSKGREQQAQRQAEKRMADAERAPTPGTTPRQNVRRRGVKPDLSRYEQQQKDAANG